MPTVTDRVQFPEIKLAGAAVAVTTLNELESLRVDRSLWMPSRCTIRFSDPQFTITDAATFQIGQALTVSLPDITGTIALVFDGEITDLGVEPDLNGNNQLVVGAMDKGHRLASETKLRTFADKTYSDIVSTIASDARMGTDVTATSPAIPYVVQTVNNYAFLWELARRVGYDWWVDAGKLCFKPSPTTAGPTLTYGGTLLEFRVRYSGATKSSKITVQGWDPATQAAVTGDDASTVSGTTLPKIGSDAPLATNGRAKAKTEWAKEVKTGAFMARTTTEAQAVAQALAQQADATEVFARGMAMSTPTLVPGKTVEIENMGTKVSGSYYVTSVEHTFGESGPGVTTRFTAGNRAPVGLADLLGGPASAAAPWGANGLVAGVVTNIQDPDKSGRVKVKFPSLSTADESAWARVIAPGAGQTRGIEFLPEINDEVMVGFEQGDLRYPVVLGGVWSKKFMPPIGDTAPKVKMRTIQTRLGHKIELSDGEDDGTKSVTITLADEKTKLTMAQDKVELESASGKPVTMKSGENKVEIDASGNITIKGKKVTIDGGTGDVEIKGMNIKLTASSQMALKANGPFKAEGALANLESSGITTVKGSLVKIN